MRQKEAVRRALPGTPPPRLLHTYLSVTSHRAGLCDFTGALLNALPWSRVKMVLTTEDFIGVIGVTDCPFGGTVDCVSWRSLGIRGAGQ